METSDPHELELRPEPGAAMKGLFLLAVIAGSFGYAGHLAPKSRDFSPFQIATIVVLGAATVAFGRTRRVRLTSAELVYSTCLTRKACPIAQLANVTFIQNGGRGRAPYLEFRSSDGAIAARIPFRVFSRSALLALVRSIAAHNPSFQIENEVTNQLSGL